MLTSIQLLKKKTVGHHLTDRADNIFNVDESRIYKLGKVLATKGSKNAVLPSSTDNKRQKNPKFHTNFLTYHIGIRTKKKVVLYFALWFKEYFCFESQAMENFDGHCILLFHRITECNCRKHCHNSVFAQSHRSG